MSLPKSLTTVTTFSKFLALFLFILLPFAGFYFGIRYQEGLTPIQQPQPNVQPACTKEAKICPDGTAVGRVSPSCQFAPCPMTPQATVNPIIISPTATSDLPTQNIPFKSNSSWERYDDSVAQFSIQYPTGYKIGEASPGKQVYFLNCLVKDKDGKELCMSGFNIQVYNDYNGGSRRSWLTSKFDLYKPYYKNLTMAGTNALMAIEGNTGGSSSMLIAIPKGSTMLVLSQSFVAWDPDTGRLPDLTYMNEVLSTFEFIY